MFQDLLGCFGRHVPYMYSSSQLFDTVVVEFCQTEVDDTTSVPTSKLTHFARGHFVAAGIDVSDVTELTSKEHGASVAQLIQSGIDTANRKAASRAQLIQKWTILPRDFSIAGGELGKCY